MTDQEVVKLFKSLADMSRLQILKSLLIEDMYVERLAERLDLSPATISFHLKKLSDAGAVTSRKEQYYTIYSICREVLSPSILNLISGQSEEADAQARRDAVYRQKVIDSFFHYGKLVSIPAQRKKKRICLEVIAAQFELGRPYTEPEVNEIIQAVHEDYCTLRRDLISEHIFQRDGQTYLRLE